MGNAKGINVRAETTISRSPSDVSRFAMEPSNDPQWIKAIKEARLLTAPPVAVGAQVQRTAFFLGRRIDYVLEVEDLETDRLMVMRSIKGPFPMKVTYRFEAADEGVDVTRASLEVEGGGGRFFRLAAPLLGRAVRRNLRKDLACLKAVLETR